MSNARNQLNYSNDLFFKYALSREDEGSVYARNTIIERVTGIKVKESTVLNPNLTRASSERSASFWMST